MADRLKLCFEDMLKPDNQVRNNAEIEINNSSTNYPNEFIQISLSLFDESNVDSFKNSIIICLSKLLDISPTKNNSLYLKLTPENRNLLKNKLMVILVNEKSKHLKIQIANMIGDFSSSLLFVESLQNYGIQDVDRWPGLGKQLIEIYKTQDENNIICVLKILSILFCTVAIQFVDNISEIYHLIQNSLNIANIEIKFEAINLFVSAIEGLIYKDNKVFKNLMNNILIAVKVIIESNNEDIILKTMNLLFDLVELEVSFYNNNINDIFVLTQEIIKNNNIHISSGIQDLSIELIISIFERFKTKIKKNDNYINYVIEMILYNMCRIDDEIDQEWLVPPQGYTLNDKDDNEESNSIVKNSLKSLDKLIGVFGKEFMLTKVSSYINVFIKKNDWKYVHAGLMALSQIGEYLKGNYTDIELILKLINDYIKNDNPKIRYACLHVLGQFSFDLKPNFQKKYTNIYFELINNTINDPIVRVRAHCLNSLVNFLEPATHELVSPYFKILYNHCIETLKVNNTYLQESAILCLSALIQNGDKFTIEIENQLMLILIDIIKNCKGIHFKMLRSLSLECSMILATEIGIDKFNKYFVEFINILINIQTNELSDNSDVDVDNFSKCYILKAWKKLIELNNQDLSQYIDKIIPPLINKSIIKSQVDTNKYVLTYDVEEALEATETLKIFLTSLGNLLIPYLQDIYNLIIKLMEFNLNEDVRINAIELLIPFIDILKNSNNFNVNMLKEFINKILKIMDDELDAVTLTNQGGIIRDILNENNNFLNHEELIIFYNKFIKYLKESDKRKSYNKEIEAADDKEDKEDVDEYVEEEEQYEEEWCCLIADIFGKIFKSHKNNSMFIAENLFNDYIQSSITPNNRPKVIKFGLFLIDDIIDHLAEFLNQEKIIFFWKILSGYSNHEVIDVRHAAIYGLGCISLQVKEYPYLNETLELLYKAYETPLKTIEIESDIHNESYLSLKDNITASFGKILKSFSNKLNQNQLNSVVSIWYKNLPLLNDNEEGLSQHELFCDILNSNPQLLNGPSNENIWITLQKLLSIYELEEFTNEKINNFIKLYFKNNQNILGNLKNLNEDDQIILKDILE